MYQNKEQKVLHQFSKIKEQNTLYQNKEQNVLYQFSKIKSKILFIRIKSKMLFIRIKSNCSLSRIKSKTRIKRSRLESVCSSNGAPLYNIIHYNNIAQTDSNQENKNLIRDRKTMSVKVLK